MILKEAYIENFGKLHKEEIVFRPGINVICGGNEAGKTTFAEFLSAMLFGLEPSAAEVRKTIPTDVMSRGMRHPTTRQSPVLR